MQRYILQAFRTQSSLAISDGAQDPLVLQMRQKRCLRIKN